MGEGMRIATTFLCGLDQIDLPQLPQRGERFADRYHITKDAGKIAELIAKFGDGLGSVETSYLTRRASAVVYRSEVMELADSDVDAFLAQTLIDDMLALKRLELGLWLVKDNASHFDRTWVAAPTNKGVIVHGNNWAARNSSASGDYEATSFSADELRSARTFKTSMPVYLSQAGPPTMLAKGSLRFQRFQYFIGAARGDVDVAMKIAQYCSGLEALVSTSQQELSHQVSERVAVVLRPPGAERVEMYQLIKQAYGYRSKAVHGAAFKPADVKQLRDCSRRIDEVCRELFGLYFQENGQFRTAVERVDEAAARFFLDAVLGNAQIHNRD